MYDEKAVVLLSGGLDSATTLYLAKKKYKKCFCLIFDYGQRHKKEIKAARKLAKEADCQWQIVKISLPWKGSSLLDNSLKVSRSQGRKGIPPTYVPARNTIFLSFALSFAEGIGASAIFIGANALDYSGYPDCRPEYYRAFRNLNKLATKAGIEGRKIRIFTPLINKTKAQIIKIGTRLGVPYQLTWSCYQGRKVPCGECDSCLYRAKGFKEAGMRDPALRGDL